MLAEQEMIIEKVKQALRDKDIDSSTRKPSGTVTKRKADADQDAKVSSSRIRMEPIVPPSNNDAVSTEQPPEASFNRYATSQLPVAILPMPHQPDIQSQLLPELQRYLQAQTTTHQQQQQLPQPHLLSLADLLRNDQLQGQSLGGLSSYGIWPSFGALAPSFHPPPFNDYASMYSELFCQQNLLQRLHAAAPESTTRQVQQHQQQQQSTPPSGVINPMQAALASWLRARQDAEAQQLQQQTMQRVMQETLRWLAPAAAAATAASTNMAIPPVGPPPQPASEEYSVRPSASGNEEEGRSRASPKQEEGQQQGDADDLVE
jgi:hypothetical protein